MWKLIEEIKKTVVFLGKIDNKGVPQFYATGFLVLVQDIFHLITAKHVVADIETGQLKDHRISPPDRLFELYDIFFLSYQPGVKFQKRITPIIRSGTISIINEDKTLYIDAPTFPGNSGSPVFLKPSPIRFDEKGISIGGDKLGGKFIGIIGDYIPYQEVAISTQTGRPRIVFEENTDLSRVWSVSFIKEIIESTTFKEQLNNIE